METGWRHNPEKLDAGHFLSESNLPYLTNRFRYDTMITSSAAKPVDWRQQPTLETTNDLFL